MTIKPCRHYNLVTDADGTFCGECGHQVGKFLYDRPGPGDIPVITDRPRGYESVRQEKTK